MKLQDDEVVLSDVTETRQHLLQLLEDERTITLFCGVFFRMLGEPVYFTVYRGYCRLSWPNNPRPPLCSREFWIIPQLIEYKKVCVSVCLYIQEKIELALLASSHVSITNVRGPKPLLCNCLCLKHFSKTLSGKLFSLFHIWGSPSSGPFITSVR